MALLFDTSSVFCFAKSTCLAAARSPRGSETLSFIHYRSVASLPTGEGSRLPWLLVQPASRGAFAPRECPREGEKSPCSSANLSDFSPREDSLTAKSPSRQYFYQPDTQKARPVSRFSQHGADFSVIFFCRPGEPRHPKGVRRACMRRWRRMPRAGSPPRR